MSSIRPIGLSVLLRAAAMAGRPLDTTFSCWKRAAHGTWRSFRAPAILMPRLPSRRPIPVPVHPACNAATISLPAPRHGQRCVITALHEWDEGARTKPASRADPVEE